MLVHSLKKVFLLFGLLSLAACAGEAPQVSGVVAIANYETVACVGQQKTLQIRNNNTSEPQRIQGVHFEFGTNDFDAQGKHPETLKEGESYFQFFTVDEVSVGNTVKQSVGNMVQEIIIPPGGIMTVKASYNPKVVTSGDGYHNTYLDVVLNGPKLGVMQIELRGKAATAAEGCTTDGGAGQEFDVLAVRTTLSHKDLPEPVVTDLVVADAVTGTLKLTELPDGNVQILQNNWPKVTFPLPDGAPLEALEISLEQDTGQAPFGDDGSLTFEGTAFNGSSVIHLTGLKLTTGSVTIDSSQAPNVHGGTITFEGSPLSAEGEMKLVVAAPLLGPPLEEVAQVGGGVFGMEITVKKK
ncbi:MAG TPA: hypothetical protein VFW62_05500 [bacterium]|nr:hypothetical protein [bacterium]